MADKVRWGVIGATARVATQAVIPAICESDTAELVAVASRSLQSARDVAGECGQTGVTAYGDYDSLLADGRVEVVYIPLPNNLHVGWAVEAMNNGKHVLCEKPLTLSAAEAREMAECAEGNGVLLSEAFMYWYHPLQQDVWARLKAGEIGTVSSVHADFSFVQNAPEDYRRDPSMGGGALLDVGCYGVHIARQAFGREPIKASASWVVDPDTKVDTSAKATLDFGGAGRAEIACAFGDTFRASYKIVGTAGTIAVSKFFGSGRPAEGEYVVTRVNGSAETHTAPPGNLYVGEVDALSRRVRGEDVALLSPADAVGSMAALDAIALACRAGQPIDIQPGA